MKIVYWVKGDTQAYLAKMSFKKWLEKLPNLNIEKWEEDKKYIDKIEHKKEATQ